MNILTQALKSILGLEASTPCGEHASTQPTVAAAGGETTVGNEKLPDRDFNMVAIGRSVVTLPPQQVNMVLMDKADRDNGSSPK